MSKQSSESCGEPRTSKNLGSPINNFYFILYWFLFWFSKWFISTKLKTLYVAPVYKTKYVLEFLIEQKKTRKFKVDYELPPTNLKFSQMDFKCIFLWELSYNITNIISCLKGLKLLIFLRIVSIYSLHSGLAASKSFHYLTSINYVSATAEKHHDQSNWWNKEFVLSWVPEG